MVPCFPKPSLLVRSGGWSAVASLLVAATLALAATPAQALIVTIDEFVITRNNVLYFRDTFSDGNPPPSAPNFANNTAASYATSIVPVGQEANGRLRMDSSQGAPGFDALGNPTRDVTARLLSNNDPLVPNGLKPTASFTVSGLFDLPAVFTTMSSFQVRLWERDPQLGTLGLTQVRVSRGLGDPMIQFRFQDFVAGTVDLRAAVPLDLSGNPDQILLGLAWDPTTQQVIAGYQYWLGGLPLGSLTQLGGGASLFTRRGAVQAGFSTNEGVPPAVIPVPASALLLGPGLIGLLAIARRRIA